MIDDERRYLYCCYEDPAHIDAGVAAGITAGHFDGRHESRQWQFLCQQRMEGKPTDPASVYSSAVTAGVLDGLGGIQAISGCSSLSELGSTILHGPALLSVLLTRHARRSAWKLASRAKEALEGDDKDLPAVGRMAEEMAQICAGRASSHRTVDAIAEEAISDASASIAGEAEKGVVVTTGLERFDQYATGMRSHEYIVVAGRSSHGKSSLMLQVAGHNIAKGLRVAIFSLETSDKSVVKQIAAQRAGVDLRNLAGCLRERQEKYLKALTYLRDCKSLLVFDRELTIDAISARCRLLAQSFLPNLVILDYMGLIGGADGTAYERVSKISKAMIPLQKNLGCALMVGCQLNQGAEKEEREPTRTDFRDSGQILEDCHRAIAVWRKPGQLLDQITYDYEILQLKLRDGPLAKVACKFNAPHTQFYEA